MIDSEKVIEGLEAIREFFGFGLPSQSPVFETYQRILIDALAILKEQEAVQPIEIIDEKYPVKDSNRYKGYRCGKCKEIIPWDANYCPYCGRKVNWDD